MTELIPDHLYVIGEPGAGVVKVGRARDPDRRLREFQTGYPRDLAILHVALCAGSLESPLHDALAQWRCRGEWFDFGDSDPVSRVREAIRDLEDSGLLDGRRRFTAAMLACFCAGYLPPGSVLAPVVPVGSPGWRRIPPSVREAAVRGMSPEPVG